MRGRSKLAQEPDGERNERGFFARRERVVGERMTEIIGYRLDCERRYAEPFHTPIFVTARARRVRFAERVTRFARDKFGNAAVASLNFAALVEIPINVPSRAATACNRALPTA